MGPGSRHMPILNSGRSSRTRARVAGLILTTTIGGVAAVSACTAASRPHPFDGTGRPHASGGAGTPTAVSTAGALADRHTPGLFIPWLPIQLRTFTIADARIVNVARFRAEATCMHDFGLAFPKIPVAPLSAEEIAARQNRRYGITDPSVAERFGYRFDASMSGGDGGTPLVQQLNNTQKEVFFNATGALSFHGRPLPEGVCLAKTVRDIAGSSEYAHSQIGAAIAHDSFQQSQVDPKVIRVFASWSRCMASRGYKYTNPLVAGLDLIRADPQRATAREITAALTDIDCKTRTNLVRIWFDAESAIEQKMITKNATAVAAAEAAAHSQLARARAILSGR